MHKIDRSAVAIPQCLIEPLMRYDDLRRTEKEEIRVALLTIQGERCAYCERRTGSDSNDGHIEHFRNQANYEELDCSWDNLFWSCNDEKTCGRYKDKCIKQSGPLKCFNRDEIIDPANEDPEKFLLFVSDGTVRPQDGVNELDRHRAQETLRVFQLDSSPFLRKSREDAVKPYIGIIEMLITDAPDHVLPYIQREISRLATTPFSTAIKSFLKSVIER